MIKSKSVFDLYGTRALLFVSGVIAVGIALTILLAPRVFYGTYGIDIGANVSLTNELKAPASLLLFSGLAMLAGFFKSEFTSLSLVTGAVVYLSYGMSRVLSIAMDGVPHSGLVSAALFEIVIGAVCVLGHVHHRKTGAVSRTDFAGDWSRVTKENAP